MLLKYKMSLPYFPGEVRNGRPTTRHNVVFGYPDDPYRRPNSTITHFDILDRNLMRFIPDDGPNESYSFGDQVMELTDAGDETFIDPGTLRRSVSSNVKRIINNGIRPNWIQALATFRNRTRINEKNYDEHADRLDAAEIFVESLREDDDMNASMPGLAGVAQDAVTYFSDLGYREVERQARLVQSLYDHYRRRTGN